MSNRKIGIVGAGAVGATAAYSLTMMGTCKEIVLYDINSDLAIGKAIDIEQSTAYARKSTTVTGAKDASDLKDCDIVVITAGVPRKDGMTREDLLIINAKIIKDVVENIKKYSPNSKIICVSNPLDVMTYVVHKLTGWENNRIMGMAGALDSSRMAYQINKITNFGCSKIKAMVIGDHGENMIPCPSMSNIGGIPLTELVSLKDMEKIIQRTKNGGASIVKHLGTSAYYAPGRAIAVMVEAILDDSKIVMPTSVMLTGEYGHKDVTVGVPVILGKDGVEKIIELDLDVELQSKFDTSVETINNGIKILKDNNFFN
ncbi:MAG: malate dehydrogenase [Campylobacterota bacterium]|nr:malate dehydrogenase [Campylobacterota bacterium]